MRTTADVVSHVNVEQGKRTILFRMKRESTLVGIAIDATLDGRNFRRLSHFHFLSFLLLVFYQIFFACQYCTNFQEMVFMNRIASSELLKVPSKILFCPSCLDESTRKTLNRLPCISRIVETIFITFFFLFLFISTLYQRHL